MSYTLGETVKLIAAMPPAILSAGSVNGAIIDRFGFFDGIVHLVVGTASGAPTAQSVAIKIQTGQNPDGSDMADVDGDEIAVVTSENTEAELNLDLNGYGRYLRVVPTVAFTDGDSPTIPVAVTVALGKSISIPV